MHRFITSDLHLNHFNIIKLANRPFKTLQEMHNTLLHNINEMVKPDDTLYHLGDLMLTSGKQAEGSIKAKDIRELIHCNFINILGNHDKRNRLTKNSLAYAVLPFGKLKFLLSHVPPIDTGWEKEKWSMEHMLPYIDCVLCGHVHNNWKSKIYKDTPFINMSVEIWNYRPVKMEKIHYLTLQLLKGKE